MWKMCKKNFGYSSEICYCNWNIKVCCCYDLGLFLSKGSFEDIWVSAAGAESFICSTVKSINTHSNQSVAQCYSPHLLRDWTSEQTQRCGRLCWGGGCSLCHDNYMWQGWLLVGEAFTFTPNMRVWKSYSRMLCIHCTAPKKSCKCK